MRFLFKLCGFFALCLLSLTVITAQTDDTNGDFTQTQTETPIATALPADVTPTAIPAPEIAQSFTQDGVTLNLYFTSVKQGRTALMHVTGDDITAVRARFLDRVIEFFPIEGETGFFGLLAINIEQTPRDYDLSVYAIRPDESRVTLDTRITVSLGGFIGQAIEIPPERAFLLDPELERAEFSRLSSIVQNVSETVYWQGAEIPFGQPINAPITSPFGAERTFNGAFKTRHTGWDLTAMTGTPVSSIGAGEIAFAGLMDIRGNVVIVDHGYGVYSLYAHLSVLNVTRGQSVNKGQIVGMSGNSGRSSGPHLHWEMIVNGEWVDSVDFMRMWLPS